MLNVRYDDTAPSVDRDSIAHWLRSDGFYVLIEGFG
jgi:hypothetical protein